MSHLQAIPTRVYVGNLHHSARERDLERFFKSCGRIKEILIKKNYGFVEFDDWRDAEDAVMDMNGRELLGNRMVVEKSNAPPKGRDRFGYSAPSRSGPPQRRRPPPPPPARRSSRKGLYDPPTMTRWRCIIENLSSKVSWQDLKDFMRQAGEVTYADCHKERRGEGIVCFKHEADLKTALEKLDGKDLSGKAVKLIDDSSKVTRQSRSRSRSRDRRRRASNSRSRSRSRSPRKRSRSASRSPRRDKPASRGRSSSGSPDSDRKRSRSKSPKEEKSTSPSPPSLNLNGEVVTESESNKISDENAE